MLRSPVAAALVAALIVALMFLLLVAWAEMPRWRVVTLQFFTGDCYTGSTDGRLVHVGYRVPC